MGVLNLTPQSQLTLRCFLGRAAHHGGHGFELYARVRPGHQLQRLALKLCHQVGGNRGALWIPQVGVHS